MELSRTPNGDHKVHHAEGFQENLEVSWTSELRVVGVGWGGFGEK